MQDTSLVRFVQVLCSDFWISVTLGTTDPKCHPECGCGVQGARQGAPGSRTACAPSWEQWDPPKRALFQQPLPVYPEQAPPQQMFKTQHSGSTSNTNHLEKKAANYLQAISLLCLL